MVLTKRTTAAIYSFAGTTAIIAVLAYVGGGFEVVLPELLAMFRGQAMEVAKNGSSFLEMMPIILAVLTIDLPCAILAGTIVHMLIGRAEGHAMSDVLPNQIGRRWICSRMRLVSRNAGNAFWEHINDVVGASDEKSLFKMFVITCLLEELFARWFFLEVLTKIPYLDGAVGFYLLFLTGNYIWSRIHLRNYHRAEDRNILRVLPQFVSGCFFTYVYLKYGLIPTILCHFGANAVLFSLHKVQRTDHKDALIVLVAGLYAAMSYLLMDKPLADIELWFADEPTFKLPGWQFWDYVLVATFVPTFLRTVFGLLLYDRNDISIPKAPSQQGSISSSGGGILAGIIVFALVIAAYLGMLWLLFVLLGVIVPFVPHRMIALSVLYAFNQKGASGSAVARTFWSVLPSFYVSICALYGLGFWSSMMAVPLLFIIQVPLLALRKWDD